MVLVAIMYLTNSDSIKNAGIDTDTNTRNWCKGNLY